MVFPHISSVEGQMTKAGLDVFRLCTFPWAGAHRFGHSWNTSGRRFPLLYALLGHNDGDLAVLCAANVVAIVTI